MLSYKTLTIRWENQVAWIDLNRPHKANAINALMWQELKSAFHRLDRQAEVRVVVLGAEGNHFTAGLDIEFLLKLQKEIEQLSEGRRHERLYTLIRELQESVAAIEHCRKPVLAAIQGVCMTGGVDIVSACDMRYCTTSAVFAIKDVDVAIVPDLGVMQRLPRIVGEGIARELIFTGRTFKGEEALSMAFVNQLFDDAATMKDGVMKIATALAAKSPMTIRGIKASMNYSRDHLISEGLRFVAMQNAALLPSNDLHEAVLAHSENRSARFED